MKTPAAVLDPAPLRKLSIGIPERQHRLLRHAAANTPGVSAMGEIVRRAIDDYFERQNFSAHP